MQQSNDYETIQYDVDDGVATVTLNRPEKRNAISFQLATELFECLEKAGESDDVRVIRIRGAGKVFSAGADISSDEEGGDASRWFEGDAVDVFKLMNSDYGRQWDAIWHNPKPVIAQVHGACLGRAIDLVNACDLIVASEDAEFGLPEGRFGAVLLAMLPWTVGIRKAKEMILTAESIDAAEAHVLGMVNRVVALEDLEKETLRMARTIAAMPPEVTFFGKMGVNRALESTGVGTNLQHESWNWYVMVSFVNGKMKEWNKVRQNLGKKKALEWRDEPFSKIQSGD